MRWWSENPFGLSREFYEELKISIGYAFGHLVATALEGNDQKYGTLAHVFNFIRIQSSSPTRLK